MRFLRVTGWEDFQHYKNRRAPWIKVATDLLDALEHPKFTKLTDGAKLALHHLRLLAGVTGNRIPESWITPGHLNMQTKPRVTELEAAGFVEWFEVGALASTPEGTLASAAQNGASQGVSPRARSQNSQDSFSLDSSRREEKKNNRSTGARELVEGFVVTDKHRQWAAEKTPGIDVDAATEAWRDHFRHNGYKTRAGPVCDADAAWRNWMRNEVKFSRGPNGTRNTENTTGTDRRAASGDTGAGAPISRPELGRFKPRRAD